VSLKPYRLAEACTIWQELHALRACLLCVLTSQVFAQLSRLLLNLCITVIVIVKCMSSKLTKYNNAHIMTCGDSIIHEFEGVAESCWIYRQINPI